MLIDLSQKVAIVTGSASGIGKAIVEQFLDTGAAGVLGVDVADSKLPRIKHLIERYPDRFGYIQGDVRLEETAIRFTEAALEKHGQLDVMINNAAISVVKPLHLHSEKEWDDVIDTNVKALYWSVKHIIPQMIKQSSGVILNTGSISGTVGIKGQGAYAASKGAVHQMTRQIAIEYASHGIRVNAIALGTVDTPIVQESAKQTKDPERFIQMLKQGHPVERMASPQEVARFFAYLSSDDASFFTGSILSMDGGFIAT